MAFAPMPNFTTTAGGYKFVQDRLDTHEWWLMPVATLEAAAFVYDLVDRFYQGEDQLLVDVVMVHNPTPELAFMFLILASKTCLSRSQYGQLIEREAENDLLIHGTTPISA